jgi:hypothetical protein
MWHIVVMKEGQEPGLNSEAQAGLWPVSRLSSFESWGLPLVLSLSRETEKKELHVEDTCGCGRVTPRALEQGTRPRLALPSTNIMSATLQNITRGEPGTETPACKPSYSGFEDQEARSEASPGKKWARPHLNQQTRHGGVHLGPSYYSGGIEKDHGLRLQAKTRDLE